MATIYLSDEDMRELRFEEGMEKGIEKGIEQGIEKAVIGMINEGFDSSLISRVLKCDIEKIEKIRKQLSK